MESKPMVNGHAAPVSPQEDTPGASHWCQDVLPCKGSKVTGMDGPSEPPEASGSIAGVYVEASKKMMSFYDATREHLLSLDLALCLLEAQAATGFMADLVKKKWVSVAEAVQMGLVGLELKEKLLSAEKAATGFVDPYTEEKIPLFQAMQKDLVGRDQGTRLLQAQIATGGIIDPATGHRLPADVACERGYLDEEMSQFLSDLSNEDSKGFLNPSTMERVTYMELIKQCVVDPGSGFLLLTLQATFPGLGGRVSSRDLLDSGIISSDTFRGLEEGRVSAQEVAESDSVQQFLRGTRTVAGVVLPSSEQKSLYQALREHLLMPGTALMLLQVQASTGSLTDPIKNKSYSVDEAVRVGLIGPELHEKLSSAEKSIIGYRDPCTGEMLSLFQAIRKGFVPKDHGFCLLEAQIATGGIIAPGKHLRVPTETACKWGYLDEATRQLLSSPTNDMKGFLDPSSKEKLTYTDLLKCCVTDPSTGLLLLPLGGESREGPKGTHLFFDHKTQTALENTRVPVALGKFKGKSMSLWKLLFSDYIQSEQRAALSQQYLAGMLSMQELGKAVSATIEETASSAKVTFEGLRDRVTADQLLSSEIINKDLFKKLKEGETSAKEVVSMDTVKKYLQGTGSISGLLLPDSQEKISIYQAKQKGLLRPGTSLILLEAQAATGFIIDPAANRRYSVDEALRASVIGPDVYDKLLAAEKSVTGYRDPYSGNTISLFQAMQKELIVKEHGIRLLEAQIATGGIIDPVNSHRIPVEVAYKRGYFDKKMNLILSDPSDDTKGFFNPNTHENLTYLQLKEKCITEPSTGLCVLPLNSRKRQFVDEATRRVFRSSWLPVRFGRLQGEKVSVWDLLNSEYFSEGKRREIFNHYQLRKLTLEQIRAMLEEEMKRWAPIKFPAMRGSVSAYHLMETGVIDRSLFERVLEGAVMPEEVLHMDSVRKYLYGSGSIGGIILQPSNQRISIYEAMKQNIMLPGVALPLLEAQAATGFIIDPVNNQKLCVDDAIKEGVIGPEVHEKLQHAEGAVTGYKDPFTGKKIPLFQAMKKGLIADKQAMQLMEVQMATGGIIDPMCGHYIPIESAQKRGCLDEDTSKALSKPSDDNRAFCVPDSKETVSYAELIKRCQKDEVSGFHLLPLPQAAAPAHSDEEIQQIFRETVVKERGVSLWELIHCGYFTEEQRRDFMERFRSEEMLLQELVALVLRLVGEMEMKARTQITLEGLQGSVPAVWLLDAGIITEKTFEELAQGIQTPEEVAAMESVKRYLQGTGSIAGVFIEASKKKMSFYDAMKSHLLLPGAALRLLEAQAATGYLSDPATNQRLSVRDAVRAAVVGEELTEKLLLAERAVTGYTDPYTGTPMSLFEAMNQGLIVKSHGIRLLEAQIATGGIIDPVHSHRIPVEVAYQRGYFNQEMNQILSDPSDDTKGFFDPNTHENLTYMQLLERCVQDSETGLYMLQVVQEGGTYFYIDEFTKQDLRSKPLNIKAGKFKDQTVSIWEILCSHYISEQKRKELVMQYKCKTLTLEDLTILLFRIIEGTEQRAETLKVKGLRRDVSISELFNSEIIDKKTLEQLQDGSLTLASLIKRDTIKRYLEGTGCIAGVLLPSRKEKMSIYQALKKGLLTEQCALGLLEAQAATGFLIDPLKNKMLSVDEAISSGLVGSNFHRQLLSAEKAVTGYTDPQTGKKMSLFQAIKQKMTVKEHGIRLLEAQIATGGIIDPVHSHRLPVEVAYQRRYLDDDMFLVLSDPDHGIKGFMDPNTREKISYSQLLQRCSKDRETGLYLLQEQEREQELERSLQSRTVEVPASGFRGRKVSLWELLFSRYVCEAKRQELLGLLRAGSLALDELAGLLTALVQEAVERSSAVKFTGLRRQVTASDLADSGIIDKDTLADLVQGAKTVAEVTEMASVKRYLDGTGCIAGVLVPCKAEPGKLEKMSIYQAMWKGILRQGTALVLLEAQAATGFLVDPLANRKLSVDEAVSSGLVGSELHEKLLSAERAVTGYTDPYTGEQISLFQAMQKELIVKEHGIRLLEAQIATGGIVDPVHSHRLPVEVAYRRGYFDQEMNQILSDPSDDTKGFFDPNTHENLTYMQLLRRCVPDPDTGLLMLQLMDKGSVLHQLSEEARQALQATHTTLSVGLFQGQSVTLWELLFSRYVPEHRHQDLLRRYKAGTVTISEMSTLLTTIITGAEYVCEAKRQELLGLLRAGSLEAVERSSAVKFTGLRRQVTASDLADSGIIDKDTLADLVQGAKTVAEVTEMASVKRYLDGTGCIAGVLVPCKAEPGKLEKMSIYQAMWKGILRQGTALVLLEAQRAVTGYTDPYTGEQISLFQAMQKELIVKEHGIRLLEAQIATGGIVDPVHSHRLPVEVAYRRGYFDQEMNQILSDPSDDTKGFFDPNTHENLTYMQLLRRCVPDPDTGLLMLQLMDKGSFTGLRRQVTASDLADSGIIDKDTLADLVQGAKTVAEVTEMASVKRYLDGTGCIAGVLVPCKAEPGKLEKMSIYQAMWKGILRQGTALVLLEAQAATGFLVDPLANRKLSVDEAVSSGLVGSELHEKLLSAERAVTGYTDPYTGEQISLFQAMQKELIVKEHGIRLLEAQIATGGIVDPVHSHRLPVEVAYRRGYFDQEMNQILSDPSDDTKGFFDPNTHENLTYMQLLRRCVPDPDTGLLMLQLMDKGSVLHQLSEEARQALQAAHTTLSREQELERSLQSRTVEVPASGFRGRKVSLWELLFSRYVCEAKRQELLGLLRAGSLALDELAGLLTALVQEAVERSSAVKFTGLRRQVTTVAEVTEMASVKRYLDGTGCIAGVLVPCKAEPGKLEKMSIYQAMWKGILRQGTALVLLEAQAATGFLVDPLANRKLSVDEAVSSGLVGSELHEKLLSAERAVTGYTDPYTGEQISLFQAMQKELIVKEHGIRLLEAQIATGGIVDPVHSHRLPVEVAYRRGYFDQEMNQILSDPSDDTKGFFDPNTHENLTYMQLLRRSVVRMGVLCSFHSLFLFMKYIFPRRFTGHYRCWSFPSLDVAWRAGFRVGTFQAGVRCYWGGIHYLCLLLISHPV
uniref:Epiplakin 1 n=1 Tax=Strigops habroptila TaxID=2489341 RepID=A0A672TJC4_STRHB